MYILLNMDKYEKRRLRLIELKDSKCKGVNADLARRIGRDPTYVNRMLYPEGKAGKKRIGDDMVDVIEEAFGLPSGWLDEKQPIGYIDQTAPAKMALKGITGTVAELVSDRKGNDFHVIPQYDTRAAMGSGLLLPDQPGVIQSWHVSKEWIKKNVKGYRSASDLCIVTGFGDSMRPLFNPGDPLLVDISIKTIEFDSIYFFRVGDEGFIKRLQRIPGEGIRVLSANRDNYDPWTIKQDMDFQVLGRVLKVWCSEDF